MHNALGDHIIVLKAGSGELEHFRMTVRLTPKTRTLVPFMPRDLYPLGKSGNPLAATGQVEAIQRGLNSGVLYLHFDKPDFGTVLYFQNLTAMNDYFCQTKTKPECAVGGAWPELGYLLPTPDQTATPPAEGLEAGVEVTLSDAILVFREDPPRTSASRRAGSCRCLGWPTR